MRDEAVILLVDDSDDDILLVRRAFEKAGLTNPIHTVRGGEEAVAYLSGVGRYSNRSENPLPDLVLLDLKMPKIDGFEVLMWIRSQAGIRGLPVVVLTSSDEMSDVNKAYELGANSFLVKPFEFENYTTLARVIREYWVKWVKNPETSRSPRKNNDNKEK